MISALAVHKKHSGEQSVFLCPYHIKKIFVAGREWQVRHCSMCHRNEPKRMVQPSIVYFEG